METRHGGSIRLFRFKGIDVFLHWSWFLVAAIEIASRDKAYSSITWNVLEYLALFLLVLLHEFGHSFACRQVGGKAERILLWPLGGVAYVQPPQRPGATLWSIAAWPLVNVVLLPITFGFLVMSFTFGWNHSSPDVHTFLVAVTSIDAGLLIFNLLPIYPLDGGQMVRSRIDPSGWPSSVSSCCCIAEKACVGPGPCRVSPRRPGARARPVRRAMPHPRLAHSGSVIVAESPSMLFSRRRYARAGRVRGRAVVRREQRRVAHAGLEAGATLTARGWALPSSFDRSGPSR